MFRAIWLFLGHHYHKRFWWSRREFQKFITDTHTHRTALTKKIIHQLISDNNLPGFALHFHSLCHSLSPDTVADSEYNPVADSRQRKKFQERIVVVVEGAAVNCNWIRGVQLIKHLREGTLHWLSYHKLYETNADLVSPFRELILPAVWSWLAAGPNVTVGDGSCKGILRWLHGLAGIIVITPTTVHFDGFSGFCGENRREGSLEKEVDLGMGRRVGILKDNS